MEKVKNWWEEKENRILVLKMLSAFLFPLLLCVIYCLREGVWIGELYLASAQNNDILFYYKQVEGVLQYGIPQGYFGFNESSAEIFSFASWSPLVLLPWVLWGMLFGWTPTSPIICNVFFFSLVLMLFVCWTRPAWKQMAATGVMLGLFPAVTRYLMSCLAESNMITTVVLFYALVLWYLRKEHPGKLVSMYVVVAYLTCIRPYLVLLFLVPGLFLFEKKRWWGVFTTVCTMVVCLLLYFAIGRWVTAEYFQGLYNWGIFSAFKEYGFEGGLYNFIYRVRDICSELGEGIVLSLTNGTFLGSNYCVLFVVICLVLVQQWKEKQNGRYRWILLHYVFMCVSSVGALLLLMQKVNETSRHIMSLIIVGMVLLGNSTVITLKNSWKIILVSMVCIYLYHVYPDDGRDYQIPVYRDETKQEQDAWEEIGQRITLNMSDTPSYENTIIWTFSDKVEEEMVYMSWQHMLTVPAGMGISCCEMDYLLANWDDIKSRYISALTNGEIAKLCESSGYEKIGESHGKVLYKRY